MFYFQKNSNGQSVKIVDWVRSQSMLIASDQGQSGLFGSIWLIVKKLTAIRN